MFQYSIQFLPTLSLSHSDYISLFSKSSDVALAVYLTQLKVLKESPLASSHYFSPFLDQFPNAPNLPLFWNSDQLGMIQHTQAYLHSITKYQHITRILNQSNLSHALQPFHNELFWALSMVSSRMWNIQIGTSFTHKSSNLDLNQYQSSWTDVAIFVPAADMLNHDPFGDTVYLKYNSTTETVNVMVYADIHRGDEIYINYGHKSNSILLSQYGFVMDNNRYIECWYDLYLPKEDINFEFKQRLMTQFAMDSLKFTRLGLDWMSAKAYWIGMLPPQWFDAHTIGRILSVPHRSYFDKTNNADDYVGGKQDHEDNAGIEDDEIRRIGLQFQGYALESAVSYIEDTLCARCSFIMEQITMQIGDAVEYAAKCMKLRPDKAKQEEIGCKTVDMIIRYLWDELITFESSVTMYCV